MRTVAKVGMVGALIAALVGCGGYDDAADDQAAETARYYKLAAVYPETPPLCQWVADSIVGREATFFRLRYLDTFVAVSSGGEVLCVDEPLVALRAGVIPVDNSDEPACGYCDGTPLPAESVIEMARKYGDLRTEL